MPDFHNIRLPAGWYPDPHGGQFRRWWDGKTWTQHTAPFQRNIQVYDFDDSPEGEAEDAATPAKRAPRGQRTAGRIGAALAAAAYRFAPSQRRRGRHKD